MLTRKTGGWSRNLDKNPLIRPESVFGIVRDTRGVEPVKSKVAAASFIMVLLFSATALVLVNSATANPMVILPYITIKSDGSIEPENGFINKTGSIYTLTADLSQNYAVRIQCSNIVFDGAGYIINGTLSPPEYAAENSGLSVDSVTNVTVKDLEVRDFGDFDFSMENCSECLILRVKANSFYLNNVSLSSIAESTIAGVYHALQPAILMDFSNNNRFYSNIITGLTLRNCNTNTFFGNNFEALITGRNSVSTFGGGNNLWDDGSVGNYWSDYLTKYSNASEIGNSGIGDTPYVIDAGNVDNFPVMTPFEVPPEPTPSPEPQPEQETFPTALVAGVSGASVAVVGLGLLLYFRRRNH
jgi:hypothetical protein